VIPKNLNTQFPASRNNVSTTIDAAPATNATCARPRRDTFPVNVTNDGITAKGFTIVINVMNESRTTLVRGTEGFYVRWWVG
jgi:hypothetical protein